MTKRPSRFFRLRDRPYLITCAIAGAVLVVLAILVLELVVLFQSVKASKAASPRVSRVTPTTPMTKIPQAMLPADSRQLQQRAQDVVVRLPGGGVGQGNVSLRKLP